MKELDRPQYLKQFYLDWQKLNHIYEKYAKQHGLTYISLFILQLLDEKTTQKELCDTLYFPKQTVNKVIQSFEKKGYVKLVDNEEDRRSRLISLTDKGILFQKEVISVIENAELSAFASLANDEQKVITELWKKYTTYCIGLIESGFENVN